MPDDTVAPGLCQRYTLPDGGVPPWIVVGVVLAALLGLTRWLLHRRRAWRAQAS